MQTMPYHYLASTKLAIQTLDVDAHDKRERLKT
jgi:hypothetical protein